MRPDAICWLDLETTGTDETRDHILEVGVIVTDWELNEVESWSRVLKPPDEHWLDMLDDVVLPMHVNSGLVEAVRASQYRVQDADLALSSWLYGHGSGKRVALAGSGVAHFDRRFLEAQLPKVARQLTYWSLDVGVLRRFLDFVCGVTLTEQPNNAKPHRALDDARLHLEEAREWRAFLGNVSA